MRTKNARPLNEMAIGELIFRKKLADSLIEALRTDPEMKDDPRAPSAIAHHERAVNRIQSEIDRREPQPVVIGLQSASLAGTSPNKE